MGRRSIRRIHKDLAMEITLPIELQTWVEDRVRSGPYATENEVVLEALLRLKDREAFREMKLNALRADLEIARIESEQGKVRTLDVEEIITRADQRDARVRGRAS